MSTLRQVTRSSRMNGGSRTTLWAANRIRSRTLRSMRAVRTLVDEKAFEPLSPHVCLDIAWISAFPSCRECHPRPGRWNRFGSRHLEPISFLKHEGLPGCGPPHLLHIPPPRHGSPSVSPLLRLSMSARMTRWFRVTNVIGARKNIVTEIRRSGKSSFASSAPRIGPALSTENSP